MEVLEKIDSHTVYGERQHFKTFCLKVKVKSPSQIRLFVTSWTVVYQAPLFMEFSRPEYWSG